MSRQKSQSGAAGPCELVQQTLKEETGTRDSASKGSLVPGISSPGIVGSTISTQSCICSLFYEAVSKRRGNSSKTRGKGTTTKSSYHPERGLFVYEWQWMLVTEQRHQWAIKKVKKSGTSERLSQGLPLRSHPAVLKPGQEPRNVKRYQQKGPSSFLFNNPLEVKQCCSITPELPNRFLLGTFKLLYLQRILTSSVNPSSVLWSKTPISN